MLSGLQKPINLKTAKKSLVEVDECVYIYIYVCVYILTQIQRSTQFLTWPIYFGASTTEMLFSACFSIVGKFAKTLIIHTSVI